MKLNDIRPQIETSGELKEQFFSIQDQGMIFDILRNKMYSNPILAICREISCNARDAHREVGTPEIPVHIHLPTSLEPFYKIKDFGPGISPDRMSNIFIKYTASTKRDDNIQTGGFGLGAKTPFSYSDTFTILTNYDGIQYNYACFIDETKVGKLALLSETPTTEKNGTEIIIPVKSVDFRSFADWTHQATKHWDIKPTIKGGNIDYTVMEKILEGDKWAIAASRDWNRTAKMIIDGIEYPLDVDTLKKYADSKLIDAANGHFVMYFDIGELTLSASREQIYLDKMTQEKIRERLDAIVKDIKQRVDDKIDSFDNLWIAQIYYRKELTKAFSHLSFLGKLAWKGIALSSDYVELSCPVFSFRKGGFRRNSDPNRLSRSLAHHLTFSEKSALFLNDLPLKEPGARHVRKAFDDDPTLETLLVICPNDKITADDLNRVHHLDKMAPKMLSSITKATGRKRSVSNFARLLLFKFDPKSCGFRQTSYSSLEEDINDKVLCLVKKEDDSSSREVILKNGSKFSIGYFKDLLAQSPNTSFYSVDAATPSDRIEEDLSDLEDIEDFLTEKVVNNMSIDYVALKFASEQRITDARNLDNFGKVKPFILDSNSLYLKRFELHQKIKAMHNTNNMLSIYELVNGEITKKDLEKFVKDNPEYNLSKVELEFVKKYPLLSHISYYQSYGYGDNRDKDISECIAQYVNLIDNN